MLHSTSVVVVLVLLVLVNDVDSHSSTGPHIAVVNILLPPRMTNPVEYRLQGSDGCFKWSWDHHDVLNVLPEYNSSSHCSTSARLRSIAPYSGRKETAVYATDVHTGMLIRCKVYIDNFSRIQIFHNSIKLDLDGLATLRVLAFDAEENVFSSLVGLKFAWQLMPETDGLPHHLAHVPLKESPLSDCGGLCGDLDVQKSLEDSGVFSDLYVVKGIGIGHEIVSVHLLEPQVGHMADKIVLTVAEAMFLDPPSPVFVLIGATVRYSLNIIRGNIPQVVTLPSPFHRWSVLNSSVAQVDTVMGLAYALSLGVTTITVEDTRVVGHIQMSSLHVVLPDTLCLYILPLSMSGDPVEGIQPIPSVSRWYLVSGRQYLIQTKVFTQGIGAQEIYITEGDDVKLHDNLSEYWNTFPVSDDAFVKHGWWNSRIVKATSCGLGKLIATLTYSSGHPETKEVLKIVQEVRVCNQVMFSMDKNIDLSQSILLPWVPAIYQEAELKAAGGCAKASSDYKWFSTDMATVSVSASGLVQAKKPGKATIKVVSIFDPLNYDEVVVEVLIPSSMVILPNFPVETVVGSHLQAAVTMKASNGAHFYRCDAFSSSIRWKVGSESFTIVNATGESFVLDNLYEPPCAWTYVYASHSGRTMLYASLSKEYQHVDHSFVGPIVLKASSRIAAYSPLIVHQASDGNQFGGYWFDMVQAEAHNQLVNLDDLNLVPGTQLDVMLRGGPERWDQGVDFIDTREILGEENTHLKDGVVVHQISTSYGSPYRILCQTLGIFKVVFKRGNFVGDDHPLPAVAEVQLSLTCSFPTSIVLLADEPVNTLDLIWSASQAVRGPGQMRATPITVANGRTIRISAVGISNSRKVFGNSSSLHLRWELSNCDGLASWDDAYDLATFKSSWERFLILQNASGLCIVRATVIGFPDSTRGHHYTAQFESLQSILTDAIQLQLVSTLKVDPEFNLLFFSRDARLNLSITGGSCFVNATVNNSQVVEVIRPPPDLQCSQLMLAPKGLGTALVTVYDIGLSPPIAASAVVKVAGVDWIKIMSQEEISLMEGSLHCFDLLAGINDGSTFDPSQYIYMNIRVHIEDILELVDGDDLPSPFDGYLKAPNFMIRARHLGIATLYVSAQEQSGHEILSQPIKVEVYAPPRMYPDDIFLVPGASYVLTMRGGPTIGAHVVFASMDDSTATIHKSSGRLSAVSLGNTTLVATVYGSGDTIVCQAYGRVKVGIPSSVILNTQSDQLAVGREMPIYPSFSEGNLFSFYELCKNYNWTIEDEKVLSFQVAAQSHGDKYAVPSAGHRKIKSTSYLDEKNIGFVEVFYGRSAGRTDVAVSFSCDFLSSGSFSQSTSYSASISLWVVSDLPLALGAPMTWILPSHYTTSSLLPSSSNSISQWDTQRRKGTITYSVLKECGGRNEEVQKDAISIDGDRIKTLESDNLACIQAKDKSTGRIEVASCVRVAEVAQIRITSKEFPFHNVDLAVGAELDLPINYCDVLGNPFHEAHNIILFDVQTNYPDVVSINDTHDGNGFIHIKAMRHGRALLQISFNSNLQKSDYMMISVGARLYPQNPVVHIGSHLNFIMEGLKDQVFGQWLSANESIILLDMLSGKAKAVGEGTTQVIFEGSDLKLQTEVTVSNGNIVLVDAPKETLTNVPFPVKGYGFPVKFSDDYHKYEAPGNMEILFDCKVDPYSPEHLVRSIPKSESMGQAISISVNASLREASHISGCASALFIGGFSILGMDKNLLQLNLTPESNKSIITIVGNTDVVVHWHGQDQLMISPIHREDFGIGGRAQYEVKMLEDKRFKTKVIIILPANGQRAEVDVNYEPGQRTAIATTSNFIYWAAIFTCFAVLISTVILFTCSLGRTNRPPTDISPATPTRTAPVTPIRSSPTVVNEQSPRTPQPYIEYVRRTIDETPYLRRQGRRINPQNTF
ncbi:nuclear pore complex protein GP210 isoform X2 [Cornus florida]|uniref:nuclear pore complex protein GP210 isoform X2 n=1 Tax=Cornus florida TaxID=4283 RepID=UPI002899B7C5|nr:nuclear pore complex protein GP210 isoform X2 [Cornus florida]